MILIVESNYASTEKENSVFFFIEYILAPILDFILIWRAQALRAPFPHSFPPLVFPTDPPLLTFPLYIIVRLLTISLQLLINRSLRASSRFVLFFLFLFSPFSFVQKLTGHPSSPRSIAIDPWILLFRPRILSRRSTEHKKQLAPSEVEPCTGNKIFKQIDRCSRVNK